jgi:hypothetical protein
MLLTLLNKNSDYNRNIFFIGNYIISVYSGCVFVVPKYFLGRSRAKMLSDYQCAKNCNDAIIKIQNKLILKFYKKEFHSI